jgi:hypothetical protein
MRELAGGDTAQRELAAVELVLASRRELAVTAARIAPLHHRRAWGEAERPDEAEVLGARRGIIEAYRQQNGITDRGRAPAAAPRTTSSATRRGGYRCSYLGNSCSSIWGVSGSPGHLAVQRSFARPGGPQDPVATWCSMAVSLCPAFDHHKL